MSDSVSDLYGEWFAADGSWARLLRRAGLCEVSPRAVARERASLSLLEAVVAGLAEGRLPAWSSDFEVGFAFASGIHPAYLWAESVLSADRAYAAAWLGHLDRGRPALMPAAVADCLLDTVVDRGGSRDVALTELAEAVMPLSDLRRAVERRRAGHRSVVKARIRPVPPVRFDARRATPVVPEEISLERA